jgi:hypothetical protein
MVKKIERKKQVAKRSISCEPKALVSENRYGFGENKDFDGSLSCSFWFLQRRKQGRNKVQPRDHQVFVCSQALIFTVWFGVLP